MDFLGKFSPIKFRGRLEFFKRVVKFVQLFVKV